MKYEVGDKFINNMSGKIYVVQKDDYKNLVRLRPEKADYSFYVHVNTIDLQFSPHKEKNTYRIV